MRFQIREVDFKVVAVHPPAGFVNEATKVIPISSHDELMDDDNVHDNV